MPPLPRLLLACALALALAACRRPPPPGAPAPLPCLADDLGLAFALDAGEEPPAGYSRLDVEIDHPLACLRLAPETFEVFDGGSRAFRLVWPAWALSHPVVGTKVSLAVWDVPWRAQVEWDDSRQGREQLEGVRAPLVLAPVHVEDDFDRWVKSSGEPSRLQSPGAPLVRRWERALGAPAQIVRIDRKGLAAPTELNSGPLAIVEARWDAAAGTLTRNVADRPCEGYGHDDPPPLEKSSPDRPEFVSDRVWACPKPGRKLDVHLVGYRPSYWTSR